MIAVAIVGVMLGLFVHVRYVLLDAEELALPILTLEAILASVPLATVFVVYVAAQLGKDKSYSSRLRHNDNPNQRLRSRADTDPPRQG
jgi:hypothetical protein